MKPVAVDVYVLLPEAWGLCAPCEQLLEGVQGGPVLQARSRDDLPADWQLTYDRLAQLLRDFRERYGDRILIRLVDPRSPQGLVNGLRYGIRQYPTFVIGGRESVAGLDPQRLDQALRAAGVPSGG